MPHATPHSSTPPTPADRQRAFLQSGSRPETGDTIFYKFDTFNGPRQSAGKTDCYDFSDGSSTTRHRVGNTDFYSGSTPSLSGLTNRIGRTMFGAGNPYSPSNPTNPYGYGLQIEGRCTAPGDRMAV